MGRRRPGRYAARREEAARRQERAAAPPPPPPHYGDVERRLAEEVRYLHSLWRSGPPAPAVLHPGGGSLATHVRADRRKRRRLERMAEPEDPGYEWPLPPSPPASPSPASWPDSSPTQRPPSPQPSPAWLAQRTALRAAEEFFSGHASGDDEDDEKDGSGSEDEEEAAAGFFVVLFERDAELRGYYERSYEEGEFVCMGCAGRKARRGRARRFRDCISLVQHARAATRCGRRRAHRALAATVCRVLGWDIEGLPSIVIDPRGTLGQSLAAATSHQAKENVDTSLTRENDNENAAKEHVSLGKNSSSSDKEEDVDRGMNDAFLSDRVTAKEDVYTMKSGPSSNGNDGEVHEQENVLESAEKEDTNGIDPLSSKGTPMELCKSVQEEHVDSGMNDAFLSDGVGAKEDVDTMKSGPSCNGNDGEVHEQENVIESAEKEDTNDIDPQSSKDTPMELCKSVQEEKGATDNKQEHAKSADDMVGTCNVSLENNSPKEEAARENKENHTNYVGTKDDNIGNMGTNLLGSSKVYSGTHDIWISRTEILD